MHSFLPIWCNGDVSSVVFQHLSCCFIIPVANYCEKVICIHVAGCVMINEISYFLLLWIVEFDIPCDIFTFLLLFIDVLHGQVSTEDIFERKVFSLCPDNFQVLKLCHYQLLSEKPMRKFFISCPKVANRFVITID